ncbi:MAG: SDR family NAD(P)-dependent oxidoreductase [Comamonadaceae bacterium]|nr:SDR family NAD(P)-dependent oxidoreductase [Burkholderiales bacterium]MEB2349412.1 SDR family NAD(P)-dependent oxidoreductase [Comamonadaceae bacterium]
MVLDFTNRVAIVTGAGGGLGRQHALALARRGAKVIVNDLGGAVDGSGGSVSAAQAVVHEIVEAGGEALANGASVTDFAAVQAMVQQGIDAWGRVDILVNNAGILRDKSFAKMEMDDFRRVVEVHLMGAAHCCKAVWPHMQAQKYGRILMTTSSTGLYGNFGQTNYGAAKLAQVGMMQTLAIEGAKYGIHVNALAPTAATRMTEDLLPAEVLAQLQPASVVPAMLVLTHESAPTRTILCAGAGSFEAANITLTQGIYLGTGPEVPEELADRLAQVCERDGEQVPQSGSTQGQLEVGKAMAAHR